MSIASEIERLQTAKADLKTAIEKRGITVGDTTIENYTQLLNNCPYSMKGQFTPSEDTNIFSIQNLPFKPHTIIISNIELYNSIISGAVICYAQINTYPGVFTCGSEDGQSLITLGIKPNSTAVNFLDNAFILEMPSSLDYKFKAGYTYEFIISGGYI